MKDVELSGDIWLKTYLGKNGFKTTKTMNKSKTMRKHLDRYKIVKREQLNEEQQRVYFVYIIDDTIRRNTFFHCNETEFFTAVKRYFSLMFLNDVGG